MKNNFLCSMLTLIVLSVFTHNIQAHARSVSELTQGCATCHGDNGVSEAFRNPSIAGQQPEYFAQQLHSFLDDSRSDSANYFYMLPAIGGLNLTDAEIKAIANYFAKLPAGRSRIVSSSSEELKMGANIYNNGIPSQNIMACSACHGIDGKGSAAAPALAAQDFFYTKKRLYDFQEGDVDSKATVMPAQVKSLDDDSITAVSKYINSMKPVSL